ncbi:MAG: glycoside hydrolase family 99-like domain-containing protein [Lysobacterales bacterium]|jgi:glycosyltransferase involved in cell wall biosynthesis
MTQDNSNPGALEPIAGKWDRKPVLLFVDHQVPQYDLYAGSRTNFMYLQLLLEMGFEVKFLPTDFHCIEPYSGELGRMGVETLDGDWFRENWQSWLVTNGRGIDYVFMHKPDPAVEVLPVVLETTSAAIIYQCHDLHYLRLQRMAEVESDPEILEEARRYEEIEDYIFSNSDVLLTFSEVEERFIRAKYPDKKVFTVPLFFYRGARDVEREFGKREGLLFVGACAHTPNQDAIEWFSREIFPLVLEEVPEAVFNVVSADPPEDIAALDSDSVNILGRVSDEELAGLYRSSKLMVVPLRFGAGVKGKVIESLYEGLPIVSTGIGLEGIKGIDAVASPVDTPEDFASELVRLYRDEKELRSLSEAGSRFVAEHFTAEQTAGLIHEVVAIADEEAALRLTAAMQEDAEQFPARLIALYLPQFHPIPENDEFWGKGFTEWHNVRKAKPLFPGHHQPHVPGELGYYDLRDGQVRVAQAELAREYGIEGFCYYHYWFNGRRLLEHPLNELLATGEPDFPFCLCWANENWTRRWDGDDKEILVRQHYSEEDDRNHIRELIPIFQDPRYIRVNGKPLFLVYRTSDLPNPARTAQIWREEARNAGLGEIHLSRVESMDKTDPRYIGFDSATEFAPDWGYRGPQLTGDSDLPEDASDELRKACENNYVHYYADMADAMMSKRRADYKRFRCVAPSWDNWARRKKNAALFLDPDPKKYQQWLTRMIADTNSRLHGEERIVFINAWNEWAEGCHLEPDQKYGLSFLDATKKALESSKSVSGRTTGFHQVKLTRLSEQITDYRLQLQALDARIARRDAKIEAMLNSTSWRISAPVRWVKQRWLNIKNHFSG